MIDEIIQFCTALFGHTFCVVSSDTFEAWKMFQGGRDSTKEKIMFVLIVVSLIVVLFIIGTIINRIRQKRAQITKARMQKKLKKYNDSIW